jgi:NitT/TauT family transport system permease protein
VSAAPDVALRPPPPDPGTPASDGTPRAVRLVREYLPAVLVAVAGLVIWELVVRAMNMRVSILPAPTSIAGALGTYWSDTRFPVSKAALNTLTEAVGGFLIGTGAGVVVALVASRWGVARGLLLPIAVAANAIPIIALSPLFNAWFGLTNPLSKMMMAAVLSFFPVMANVTRGLSGADPGALELMRSYAASEGEILRKVRIPNALPYLFTALKLASTLSLIGAIVAEYFGGQTAVLGQLVITSISALRFDITWACITLAAGAGIVFYLLLALAERLAIPWHSSVRAEG